MARAVVFALLVAFAAFAVCEADITDDIKGKVGEMKQKTKRSVDAAQHTMDKREGMKQPVKRQMYAAAPGMVAAAPGMVAAAPGMVAAPVDAYGNPVMVQQPQYYPPPQQQIIVQQKQEEQGGFFNNAFKAFFAGGR